MNTLHRVINSHSNILQPDTITSTDISINNSIGRVFKSQIKIPVYKELLDSITSYEETIILNQLLYNMVMADWASETEYKVENIGCHLVLNTQGGEFITGNPFVWLIMMDVKDNGDDMFFCSNVKQNVFNSDSYSKPVWTLFFDRKEITHYIHKIRKINNSDVFKNLVENWLYFTVQDNGLTSIDVFNPVGPDN